MADIVLNNYSDDSRIKEYIQQNLMTRVFHNIPLNVLNTGAFSIINEYISQVTEQMAFTSSFYFNESFITKAVLPDSIYAEAAIFNIGYAFATPSSTNILLELRLNDLFKNATMNAETGFMEFILDRDTKFNLPNGNIYSLDYDIRFRYYKEETAKSNQVSAPAWDIQYINYEPNMCATNKNPYIVYRVTDTWLCLFINASEYKRTKYVVVNSNPHRIPNEDYIIQIDGHICGFDVVYITPDGVRKPLSRDHILPIHDDVKDLEPYIHYIMDNPQTIRLMFQLAGTHFFIPEMNSQFEITVYTCHGKAANFTEAPNVQPSVITATSRYANNANVSKAAFVINGSLGGTDIGNAETVRRETIEAYNTANVISTDHDIDEWFKTFYFKNVIYPYFYKRRDDPWGRIWSGFLALQNDEGHIYPTNTLHGKIPYYQLYENGGNLISQNEVIIPPGWIWIYSKENNWTVNPYVATGNTVIETANTLVSCPDKFAFANPFGVKIQKDPFAICYMNPWIDVTVIPTKRYSATTLVSWKDRNDPDVAQLYHATPIDVEISRTYLNNFYRFETYIDVSQLTTVHGKPWVNFLIKNAQVPELQDEIWNYFNHPRDMYAQQIPMIPHVTDEGALPFDPEKTFLCVKDVYVRDDGYVSLNNVWIHDTSDINMTKDIALDIFNIDYLFGDIDLWGKNGVREEIIVKGDNAVTCYGLTPNDLFVFVRSGTSDYYTLKLKEHLMLPNPDMEDELQDITIQKATIIVDRASKATRHKYGESCIWNVGDPYQNHTLIIELEYTFIVTDEEGEIVESSHTGTLHYEYIIQNSVNTSLPYFDGVAPVSEAGKMFFEYPCTAESSDQGEVFGGTVLAYANMKASPSSKTVDYYQIPFSTFTDHNKTFFYLKSTSFPLETNQMRVLLHTYHNGVETGRVEMLPVQRESDGAYLFRADMYPLTELLDVDDVIRIASLEYGGGNWTPANKNSVIAVNAVSPEIRMSILFKTENNPTRLSDIEIGDSYTGYILADQYDIKDFSLVQELKEMRSVVNFGYGALPTVEQVTQYRKAMEFFDYDKNGSIYDLYDLAYRTMLKGIKLTYEERLELSGLCEQIKNDFLNQLNVIYQNSIDWVDATNETKNLIQTGGKYITDAMDLLIQNQYDQYFTYQDENLIQVYTKYYSRYEKRATEIKMYLDFIIAHPYSQYEDEDDGTSTYYQNRLLTDLMAEYPYEENKDHRSLFPLAIYLDNHTITEPEYLSNMMKHIIAALELLEEMGGEFVIDGRDYSTLYLDEDCMTPVTYREEYDNTLFYVKEENGLDTFFKFDNNHILQKQSNIVLWENLYHIFYGYKDFINDIFKVTNVNSGLEIQLMPFVEYSLLKSDQFKNFVKTFTQVHKAIEPVIFKRLEGNHYLDCKLVATYGLPHSYCSDQQYYSGDESLFWPDLNIQISFNVKLYNRALAVNTKSDLRGIVRDYFNRLTTVHTPKQLVSMNNNIYISHVIQRMEEHANVAYLKFNGWYVNEKNTKNGNYMGPDVQSIIQRWRRLEDMPTDELERFVPEMFVLDEENIEINIIDDNVIA